MSETPEPEAEDAEESAEGLGPLPYTSADSTGADVVVGAGFLQEAGGCLHDLAGCFTVVAGLVGLAVLVAVAVKGAGHPSNLPER